MDVREYYREIREIQGGFTEPFVVVVSEKTRDGGRAGVMSEVSAALAAKVIQEGKAKAATAEQASAYRKKQVEEYAAAKAASGPQVQVMVVAEQELQQFKTDKKRKENEK